MQNLSNHSKDVDREGCRVAAGRPGPTGTTSRLRGAARCWQVVAVLTILVGGAVPARAGAILTLNATTTINGDTPSGTMSATIADTSPNTVRITLQNNLTDPDEFAVTWGFGLQSSFTDYSGITFTQISTSPKAGSPPLTPGPLFADTAVASANTGFNPSSIGDFNVRFDWEGNNRSFTAGTTVVYDLSYSGLQTFNALLFNATNHNPGAGGIVYTAVKIQGIGPRANLSGELGDRNPPSISVVPEPLMFAKAAWLVPVGLIAWRRRRKQVAAA